MKYNKIEMERKSITGIPRAGTMASTLPHKDGYNGDEGRDAHYDEHNHGWMSYSSIVAVVSVALVHLVAVVGSGMIREQIGWVVVRVPVIVAQRHVNNTCIRYTH